MGRGSANGDMRFGLTFDRDPKLIEQAFTELGEDFKDLRDLWGRVWPIMATGTQKNLGARGATLVGAWPAYTADYARRKARGTVRPGARGSKGRRLELHLTGQMRHLLSGKQGLIRLTKRAVSWGSRTPYARAVQFAGKRFFIGWSSDMKSQMQREYAEHGDDALRRWSKKVDHAGRGQF